VKDHLRRLVAEGPPAGALYRAREYLQALILGSLQRAGAMIPLAFHGGTALRFLYGIPRYSEDLDFALERPGRGYDFRAYLRAIRTQLQRQGYAVEARVRDDKTVHGAFLRFPGLPHELGLSPHPSEVLAVKIEVDTHPPAGAGLETSLVRRHLTLNLQHHDRASLFAGKLHALLSRRFTKGRDLYDLLWYLSDRDWPPPNLTLLANALAQTGWTGPKLAETTWKGLLRERLETLDWRRVRADVAPFLESAEEVDLLDLGTFRKLLAS
jgi:Nucleotidyl transferase AbiEii toxin, Type IV TA system